MAMQSLLNSMAINYLYCANIKDMPKIKDLTGIIRGRLTVISFSHSEHSSYGRIYFWNCLCSCGNVKAIRRNCLSLKSGSMSCGCAIIEINKTGIRNKKHEDTGSKEYTAWNNIKSRCFRKTNKHYRNYGGRGITVCDRWLNSYSNFISDVGRAPSDKHSLDRINNNGNYEPGNVKWSTIKDQSNNKRTSKLISYNGETMTVSRWANKLSLNYKTLWDRINNGWTIDRAFTTTKNENS